MRPHFQDILQDNTLLEADIIHLNETSITEEEENDIKLPGFNSHFISVGNGKGVVTFIKDSNFTHEQDLKAEYMQIVKFTSRKLDVINVYRSRNGNYVDLFHQLQRMTTRENKPMLVTGDFNICFHNNRNNRMSKGLEQDGFKQLVQEPTHIRGGHIDHAYWKDKTAVWKEPELDRYSPYYSDHDALCLTLTQNVSNIFMIFFF